MNDWIRLLEWVGLVLALSVVLHTVGPLRGAREEWSEDDYVRFGEDDHSWG